MTIEFNKGLVTEFLTALVESRIKDAMDLVHEDCYYWVIGDKALFPFAGEYNKEELERIMSGSLDVHDDKGMQPSNDIVGITAEGNRVAVETVVHVPLQDGGVYNQTYHWLFEVNDRKISVIKEYLDTIKAMNAFGTIAERPVYCHESSDSRR